MRNLSILVAISLMIGAANHCQAQEVVTVHANVGQMLIDVDIENLIFDPFDTEWVPDLGDLPTEFLAHCGGAGIARLMVPPQGMDGGTAAATFNPVQTFSFEAHLDWYKGLPPNFNIQLALAAIEAAEVEVGEILDWRKIEYVPGSIKALTWGGPYSTFSLNSDIISTSIVVIDDFTYEVPGPDFLGTGQDQESPEDTN